MTDPVPGAAGPVPAMRQGAGEQEEAEAAPVRGLNVPATQGVQEVAPVSTLKVGDRFVVRPGERIVFKRDPNYWAKDLPSKVGMDNFDEISIEYFLQDTTLFEA